MNVVFLGKDPLHEQQQFVVAQIRLHREELDETFPLSHHQNGSLDPAVGTNNYFTAVRRHCTDWYEI